jgi:hypothetical protein
MQQKKQQRPDPTPTSRKIIMAVAAVIILLGMLYILNGNQFPTEITYRNVSNSGGPYVRQRENP